jgi:hypothetical protein
VLIVSCKLLIKEFFVLPKPTFKRNYRDIAAMESDVNLSRGLHGRHACHCGDYTVEYALIAY